MSYSATGDLYPDQLVSFLEIMWGEGWLSPGGPEEVERLIAGIDFAGKRVLDIGCGVGGVDFLLCERHGAGHVTAIDFVKVEPGPFPFPDQRFDIVFSKDSIVHIADKHALMREVWRVLRPGGWFVASDWLIGHDGEPSPRMKDYIASEGLDFGMASPERYRDALEAAGFTDIGIVSRNAWYRDMARHELAALKGEFYDTAVARLGRELVDHNVGTWTKMIVVLDSGEHAPHHLRGRKPEH